MKRLIVVALAALALTAGRVQATQTENYGIHAVPAPGKVVIDGKLDDWDLSGEVLQCYDLESLRDIYSARIAMMYDSAALYVSLHWKDPTPMGNCHHPRYQANKGWAGDCVQLRFKTDRIGHATAWYYAALQEPALQIEYGKSLTDPFGGGSIQPFRTEGWKMTDGVEQAFLKDADGRGYVQELKLPWALLTAGKRYGAGDRFQCGIELLWGEADWPVHRYADNLAEGATSREFFWTAHNSWGAVILEPKGRLKLPKPAYLAAAEPEAPAGPVAIRYTLPQDARVTLAIDDTDGRRVRNLIAAIPRKKGANAERWDGLDDDGKPVPPGAYVYKVLYHQGIHANWVMSFASPGNPSWDTPDGRGAFYGDHTAPQAAAAAGDFVALACPMGEAGKHLIGCNLEGQRLWGLANRVAFDGGHISLATDGKTLWVATEGKQSIIYRVEMATGKYAPWNATAKDAEGKDYRVLDLPVSELPGVGTGGVGVNMTSISLHDGVLAVCLAREGKVRLLDAETGAEKGSRAVEDPRAAAFEADGSLLVLSGERILRLAPDGTAKPFCNERFPDGSGLAVDAQRNVYLSARGADQNVKLFSPQGKLLREIGKRGGRPACGAFDENGMRQPGQIAIDSRGRLWVPEATQNPKRTSVWSADGKFAKDFIGTTSYAGAGAICPDDPTLGFAENTIFRIDLANGTWRPVYSLGSSGDPDDLFPPQAESRSRTITRGGIVYHYTTGSARGSREVHCTMLRDGAWRSAAHVGVVKRENAGEYAKYMSPFFEGHEGEAYAWADENGDGKVQAAELAFASPQIDGKAVPFRSFYWGQLPGPDGTIAYLASGVDALYKLPMAGNTACGAPRYDVAHPQVVKADRPLLGRGNGEGMVVGGSDGRVYLNQDPLIAVDANGKVLGGYPNHNTSVHGSHTARAPQPGYLIGPSSVLGTAAAPPTPPNSGGLGEAGEVFDLNGNLGENYLFTSDGLWIQSLFKDTRGWFETPAQAVRGMPMDACTAGGESFGGNFLRAKDGKVYLVIGGTDARVLEVSGLESIRRLNGRFTYTAKQYEEALRLAQASAAKATEAKTCTIARAAAPPAIDGKATDWPELLDDKQPAVEVRESPQRRYARVLARWDETNLYLGYRVFASSGRMRNAGQDTRLLFKTGDCVDVMLDAGKRPMRLLISAPGGQPTAVLYEKSVPGIAAKDRVPFSSPWRTITFDRVTQPADVRAAVGQAPGGYFVEVAVPWSRLGIKPSAGLKLKGDFGILYADSGGTTTIARQYWSNKATGLVNDVPGEADLTPGLWGEIVLE